MREHLPRAARGSHAVDGSIIRPAKYKARENEREEESVGVLLEMERVERGKMDIGRGGRKEDFSSLD